MPSFIRQLPRTQKTSLALGLLALLLLVAGLGFMLYTRAHPPVVQKINYTELRHLSESANARTNSCLNCSRPPLKASERGKRRRCWKGSYRC